MPTQSQSRRAALALAVMTIWLAGLAPAAELDGIAMPDTRQAAGVTLQLNGIGLRTYSFLAIHIYVAGFYLQHPSSDADAVLSSDQVKLMDIHFVRDVDERNARHAWKEGLASNCVAPCQLPATEVDRFLSSVPAFRRGDTSTLLFTPSGVDFTINGRHLGMITDSTFMRAILATFIGRAPPTDQLKRELLGQR